MALRPWVFPGEPLSRYLKRYSSAEPMYRNRVK